MNAIESMRLPDSGQRFELFLPSGAEVLRAGFDPANGQPTIWYTHRDYDELVSREFVIVETGPNQGAELPDYVKHRGMWWYAAQTFHLFEIITPDAAAK